MICFLHFLWSVRNELWGDRKMFPSGPFLTFLWKWVKMGWFDLEPSNRASLFMMKKIAQIVFLSWPLTMFFVPVDVYLQFCIFKIFHCNLIIKNYLLSISLTQSWKKSFFCSGTWQMFLVLNGMGIKDKLGPLALQPLTSLLSYTRFFSLSSHLPINGFSLGLKESTCNMEMRD